MRRQSATFDRRCASLETSDAVCPHCPAVTFLVSTTAGLELSFGRSLYATTARGHIKRSFQYIFEPHFGGASE